MVLMSAGALMVVSSIKLHHPLWASSGCHCFHVSRFSLNLGKSCFSEEVLEHC